MAGHPATITKIIDSLTEDYQYHAHQIEEWLTKQKTARRRPDEMNESMNKSLVRRYYEEVLNGRQIQIVDDLIAPNFVNVLPDGNRIDLEVYKQALLQTLAVLPDLHVTIEDQIAEGDKVVTRFRGTGTPQAQYAGIKPTGKPITVTAIHIHSVQDGRLCELWEATNLHAVQQDG
jgi:predicted ester cyclase